MSASLALLVQHVAPVGGPSGPSTGGGPLVSVTLYLTVTSVGLALAPALTSVTSTRWTRGWRDLAALAALASATATAAIRGPGALLTGLTGDGPRSGVILGVHLLAVTVWVGGVLHLALTATALPGAEFRRAVVRFTPYAVIATSIVVGTGTALVLIDRLGMTGLLRTAFGAVILVKVLAVVLAAMLGLGHRLSALARDRQVMLRGEASVLAVTLAAGSALFATPLPAAAVTQLATGVSAITLGRDATVVVFLDQTSSGGRLLLLSDESLSLDDGDRHLQLAPGAAAPVRLTRGRATLSFTSGQSHRTVRLRPAHVTAPLTPLLPSQTSRDAFALGRALAGDVHSSRCLPDASELAAATARLLRQRQVTRSAVVASDPSSAVQQLRLVAATHRATPLYLPPLLLDATVLTTVTRLRLPAVSVIGVGDPTGPIADRYRADLSLLGGGAGPSLAGLLGYESVTAPEALGQVAIFAAEPIGFLPGVLDVGHTHHDDAWIPGGALVPTTPAVSVRLTCSTQEGQ
jgi:putative copper export protein